MSKIQLYNGDCIEILQQNNLKFDIVITDLPYGVTQNKKDKIIDLGSMWALIEEKPFITTTQQPFTTDLINSNRKNFKYLWYWNKVLSTGFLNAKIQPLRTIEEVAVFYAKQPTYNPQMTIGKPLHHSKGISLAEKSTNNNYGKLNAEYETKRKHSNLKHPKTLLTFQKPKSAVNKPLNHPTEKSLELMKYLIKTYTNEGDTVLDLAMGSGTTGVACKELNRNFIGIEIDKTYYEIAKERIEND